MNVIAHGAVEEYCDKHGYTICGRYDGRLEDYDGSHPVVVTGALLESHDFYYLKMMLLKRGVELVSIHHSSAEIEGFLSYVVQRDHVKPVYGRTPFGFVRENGVMVEHRENMAVVRRILELRDSGATLLGISDDPEVHYEDGRRISVSTIQGILKNRRKYEK